jgi:DNA repair protein RecN (Recombination protein N)
LSKSRHDIVVDVQKSLTGLFTQLDLPHAHIEFRLQTSEELGPFGLDKIDINFSANSGSPLRAIENAASGGEISRVILAIKACFSGAMELPTLILDEIDTGVSGETAKKVAKVMASIGNNSQVIAISHLPQIAGQAQHHFKVSKGLEEGQTRTTIRRLEDDERVEEIAEMMTGKSLTEAARESARTLLATSS